MSGTRYMQRCLALARLGAGKVAPNPMVGAVLVHNNIIIGEGWHQQYGQAHAEVNCINNAIENGYQSLIDSSTLYVSLEPCAHFGKTPPCADLIIRHKIPHVVIGCRDPFPAVNGKGIDKLKAANIHVEMSDLASECISLNKRFFTFHELCRPYIILKWAATNNGIIGNPDGERLHITSELSNRLVHKWRSEESAILVGSRTALKDDPQLNTRLWWGQSPVRMVIDRQLQLPDKLHLFNGDHPTIVFNEIKSSTRTNLSLIKVHSDGSFLHSMMKEIHNLNLTSVLVEGGAELIQHFIEEDLWDEAFIFTNDKIVNDGIKAPVLRNAECSSSTMISNDRFEQFIRIK